MTEDRKKFLRSLIYPVGFLVLIWTIFAFQVIFNLDLAYFGILPRTLNGLIGIITAPLIHANFEHIFSNSIPFIILAVAIFYFYPSSALKVSAIIYVMTGVLVWLFARQLYHIGASGIIYGFLGYLFFSGIFKRDNRSIGLALLVTFVYGGLVWGVLPGFKGISWESHFFGGVTGILCAFIFRKYDPPVKYDWEKEEDEPGEKKLEISYRKEDNNFN